MTDEPDLYYGYDGEPIGREQWMKMFQFPDRLLKQEWVHVRDGRRVWVSTVWLGIDHNWGRQVPMDFRVERDLRPWIYETMVFDAAKPAWNDIFVVCDHGNEVEQVRHATREEALQMHEWIKANL